MISRKTCIVIGIEEGSEKFAQVHLYNEDEGYFLVLKRKSTKRAGLQHMDLFQTVEVVVERKNDQEMRFLKETQILTERINIGKSYATFECASRFCRAIKKNTRHVEDPKPIYLLLIQSLDLEREKRRSLGHGRAAGLDPPLDEGLGIAVGELGRHLRVDRDVGQLDQLGGLDRIDGQPGPHP